MSDGEKQQRRDDEMRATMMAKSSSRMTEDYVGNPNFWADKALGERLFRYDVDEVFENWKNQQSGDAKAGFISIRHLTLPHQLAAVWCFEVFSSFSAFSRKIL